MFHMLFSVHYYHITPFPFTAQRFVRTRSSVTTQCVQCVTSAAPTGNCPTVVLTPEPPTCLTTQPPLPLPLLWHCGVRQAMVRVKNINFRVGEGGIFHFFFTRVIFHFPFSRILVFCLEGK